MKTVSTRLFGLLVVLACLFLAGPASAKTVKVVGLNDINVDRQNIQNAIDSAPGEKLRVKLLGTFQLDGQRIFVSRSDLTIQGVPGETFLIGTTDATGLPAPGIESGRAFEVRQQGAAMPLANITFKGLSFRDVTRAINIAGFTPFGESAGVSNVVIKNINVENGIGVAAFGLVSDMVIKNNVVSAAPEGALYFSGYTALYGPDQKLSNVIVKHNAFSTRPSTVPTPIVFQGEGDNSNIVITHNTFEGGLVSIGLFGDPTNFVVRKNCIKDGGSQGVPGLRGGGILVGLELFGFTASGYTVENNSYENNFSDFGGIPAEQRDVWLTTLSSNNSVIERIGTVVLDEGNSNSVVLHGGEDDGYCSTDD